MEIKNYSENISREWDDYVARSSLANFFHQSSWMYVLEKTFGIKSHYLYAVENGKIVGILPLSIVKNILMRRILISVPFGVYGGICADNVEIEKELVEAAKELTIEKNASYLEIRHVEKKNLGLKEKNLYYNFTAVLPEDPEIWWNNVRKKTRNIIRKGIKSNLEFREDRDDIDGFYDLFSVCQQNLGTPVLPKSMFHNLLEVYKENATIFSTYYNGIKVNSIFVFFFKNVVMPYYIGYRNDYLQLSPNNFLLWKLIEFSCEHKYKYYDLGRSRINSGSFIFKKNMGIEPIPLHYQFFLNTEKRVPNINPSNKRFGIALNTWQKLPVNIARTLGPKLVKYFP